MNNKFPFTTTKFQDLTKQAVRSYWSQRKVQASTQIHKGTHDTGTRSEVTGGHQLDAFGSILYQLAHKAGYTKKEIYLTSPLPLPGFYRPQKKWDFTVCKNGIVIAAVELKSQSGSFGNNFNNRAEEVIGLAHDFWVAYREKAFGMVQAPWLGYLFLLEDSEKSRLPVNLFASSISPLPKFNNTSYQERYRILCETLMLERNFASTALLLSPRPDMLSNVSFTEPDDKLSFLSFCKSLFAHLVAHIND